MNRILTVNDYIPFPDRYKTTRRKGVRYIEMANAFDIETSSFMDGGRYRAMMYAWQCSINGIIVVGRTWDEFKELIQLLIDKYDTYKEKHLVIYVHNLAYEFQFIRHHFEWLNVFALEERRPVYACTTGGIEFRCSYLLSGMSLERLGDSLTAHDVKKLVGKLDYSKVRHAGTPLTDEEMAYNVNDVRVVTAYISERMEADGSIVDIPLTKTGYVRRFTRRECFGSDHRKKRARKYHDFIKELTIEPDEYRILKEAFQGGFTHANAWHAREIKRDVASFDFTSSYPYCMVAFKYPMSRGVKHDISYDQWLDMKDNGCWIVRIAFKRIRSKITYEHYLSESHCEHEGRIQTDNGRIIMADYLQTAITNVDFAIIASCYDWDDAVLTEAWHYTTEYLPKPIITALLKSYADKTKLKGVKGREADYMLAKENTNSNYGMMVTDPLRDVITYDDEWGREVPDLTEALAKYNKSRNRFLYYPWGVFITAYARFNLWTGIYAFKHDYIYADTDSVKVLNMDAHMDYIGRYNGHAVKLMERAMKHHGLSMDLVAPKDVDGHIHTLGLWDYEGTYTRFKTLGAKRYMTEGRDGISLTVSGLNKKKAIPYLLDKYGAERIFDEFDADETTLSGLHVPAGHTGRVTMRYIDEPTDGEVVDYLGNKAEYHELSSVHMEQSDWSLTIGKTYINYLLGIKESGVTYGRKQKI